MCEPTSAMKALAERPWSSSPTWRAVVARARLREAIDRADLSSPATVELMDDLRRRLEQDEARRLATAREERFGTTVVRPWEWRLVALRVELAEVIRRGRRLGADHEHLHEVARTVFEVVAEYPDPWGGSRPSPEMWPASWAPASILRTRLQASFKAGRGVDTPLAAAARVVQHVVKRGASVRRQDHLRKLARLRGTYPEAATWPAFFAAGGGAHS